MRVLRPSTLPPLLLAMALAILAGPRPAADQVSYTLTPLASFANGFQPYGVTLDAHGDLFGTTAYGGANGLGTVFEVAAGAGTITTLASFNGANGSGPVGDLALDANGDLFGTTVGGGDFGNGTVFEVSPAAVPEPGALTLAGLVLAAGLGYVGYVRFRARGCAHPPTGPTPARGGPELEAAAGVRALGNSAG
jgi:uncharacterized repeat protein (TIGR03803 family)